MKKIRKYSLVSLILFLLMLTIYKPVNAKNAIIKFGEWPQSKVTDSSLISNIKQQYPDITSGRTVVYNGSRYIYNGSFYKYEPISWIVTDETDNALLISEKIIYDMAFSSGWDGTTWKTSPIRTYLNEYFFMESFTLAEQNMIRLSNVSYKSERLGSDVKQIGEDTQDKVFLPSIDEVIDNLSEDGQIATSGTAYSGNSVGEYWVRNVEWPGGLYPYFNWLCPYYYCGSGFKSKANSLGSGIRPALRVNYTALKEYIENTTSPEPEQTDDKKITEAHGDFTSDDKVFDGLFGYYYKDSYFDGKATTYNQHLATMSLCLAFTTYGVLENGSYGNYDKNVKKVLEECGFCQNGAYSQYNFNQKPTDDSIGCVIGSKTLDDDTSLIAIAVRSGGYEKEWSSNFTMGLNGDHEGFNASANKVLNHIKSYISDQQPILKKNLKIWITGFSRGAAVATQTAAKLNKTSFNGHVIDKNSIYAYGFATPAGADQNSNPHSSDYNNIFNIIDFTDPVPLVAPSQIGFNFERYGSTKIFPYKTSFLKKSTSDEYLERMKSRLRSMGYTYEQENFKYARLDVGGWGTSILSSEQDLGVFNHRLIQKISEEIYHRVNYVDKYQNFIKDVAAQKGVMSDLNDMIGTIIPAVLKLIGSHPIITQTAIQNKEYLAIAHAQQANYVAWMQCMDSNYGTYTLTPYWGKLSYKCVSVNCPVDVEIYTKSGELVASIKDETPNYIEGSNIISMIDENGQKQFYVPDGEELYAKITSREDCNVTMSIENISAETGIDTRNTVFSSISVPKNESCEADINSLTVKKDGQTINPSFDMKTPEEIHNNLCSITVNYDGAKGTVSGAGTFLKGSFVQLIAESKPGYAFKGYYVNGNKLENNETGAKDTTIRFEVKENVTVEAKFEKALVSNTIIAKNITKVHSTKVQFVNIGATCNGGAKMSYSSDDKYIKVNSSGRVTIPAYVFGDATITITSEGTSEYTETVKQITVTVLPSKTVITKAKNISGKKIQLKWKMNKNCDGYQIQYSTDKKFKKGNKTLFIKKYTLTTTKISKLKKGKTYYVRIRTYLKDCKNFYSAWSPVKKIKVKK